MDVYVRCKVSRGQFSGELAVHGVAHRGVQYSLFVPREFVDCEASFAGDTEVDGWLRVEVLASEGELRLVRLPCESFENGRTITIEVSQIREELASH